jgi:hypothetical protein
MAEPKRLFGKAMSPFRRKKYVQDMPQAVALPGKAPTSANRPLRLSQTARSDTCWGPERINIRPPTSHTRPLLTVRAFLTRKSCASSDANSFSANTAHSLPELDPEPELDSDPNQHDMNGSARAPDDTLRTATPPRPTTTSAMPPPTTPRNVSGPLAVENTPNGTDANANGAWARPNPHSAMNNSKTSQYIDKITSENDRLRRELKAEKLAREEEAKRVSAARSKAEDSRADFQHLQVLADTNARAIERKDRKLDELKAMVDQEVNRRKVAEQRADQALKMLGDTRSETQKQLAEAYDMKLMADTHLETARDGFKRIAESYEKKLKYINDELRKLRQQRTEDADKIKRQAIISDQLQHEMSRNGRTESSLIQTMDAYKEEHRKEMDKLIAEAEKMRSALPEKEREAQKLVDAMVETRDKMKWVMTQQQRQQGGQKRQGGAK